MSVEKGPQHRIPPPQPGGTWGTQGSTDTIPAFRPAEATELQEDRIPYKHWAPSGARSLILTDPVRKMEQNLHLSFQKTVV